MKRMKNKGLILMWIMFVMLLFASMPVSFASDNSVSEQVSQDNGPGSADIEVLTVSYGVMQTREETPNFSVPSFFKLISHHSIQREGIQKVQHALLIKKSIAVRTFLSSIRVSQDYYTFAFGCLRV